MNHPAAEIVAIALRKICKLTPKKHVELHEEARIFAEGMHTIIPLDGSVGQLPRPARSPSTLSVVLPVAGTAGSEASAHSTQHQHSASSSSPRQSAQPASVHERDDGGPPQEPAAALPAQGGEAAADIRTHFSEEAASGEAQDVADLARAASESVTHSGAAAASFADAAVAAAAAAAASAAASMPALAPPDLVPRTSQGLPDETCDYILRLMTLAVDTQKAAVIEAALECIQKLIAFRFLQGSCYAISISEKAGRDEREGGIKASMDLSSGTAQAHAVELLCRCDEIPDEGVELQILKGLLTATTSTTFTVHGQALLLAVRTCYNIFLMSRSEVNQNAAKASLTQMLNVVFQRMEAQSVHIDVRPVVVTDVLTAHRPGNTQDMSMMASVQAFLNSVVMVSAQGGGGGSGGGGGLPGSSSSSDIRSNMSGAFDSGKSVLALVVRRGGEGDTEDREHAGDGSMIVDGRSREGSMTALRAPSAAGSFSGVVTGPVGVGAVLQKDAFLVFRALCKLSIRTSDTATLADPTAVRGKVLALELLKVLLDNSGPEFRTGEKFVSAIRQYLCLSLLKNSASSLPAALQLSGAIFLSLLLRFRAALKAEIGVFFPMIFLKPFEPVAGGPSGGAGSGAAAGAVGGGSSASVASSVGHKAATLKLVGQMCGDGQLLVDLFVNYDCDLESTNMFERLVNGLVKLAQTPVQLPPNMGIVPTMSDSHNWQQETALRGDALQTLVTLVDAMWGWYKHTSGLDAIHAAEEVPAVVAGESVGEEADRFTHRRSESAGAVPLLDSASDLKTGGVKSRASRAELSPPTVSAAGAPAGSGSGGEEGLVGGVGAGAGGGEGLGARRAYKIKFQEGILLFNKKPRKGIELLQKEGMLGRSAEDVARFLAKADQGLDKVIIGDYLGEREDFSLRVMHAYVDDMEFTEMEFDLAIRKFLSGFRLPGEAQKIDRLMEKFAERFCKCNPGAFKSADVAYVLAYSVIMLNTDAHNPQVKVKMSREGFIKNNRGINDGVDLAPEFMAALYERIVNNEIKLKDGGTGVGGAGGSGASGGGQYSYHIMRTLLSLVGATRKEVSNEPSDESVNRTLAYLHERAKSATLVTATEADAVSPMMELVWAPLLGVLSVLFDEYTDPRMINLCLQGFTASCCLTAQVGMHNLRDIFINSLCNFTHLHSPATMKYKNALAFKYMLKVAEAVGDHLSERWVDVLRCISRWELLQQIASGMPTDAVLFSPPAAATVAMEAGGRVKAAGAVALGALEKGFRKMGKRDAPDEVKSMDSLAMNEMSIRRVHIGGSGGKGVGEMGMSIHVEVINSVDSHDMNRPFLDSGRLDSEAIVAFVRAMTAISLDELRDAKAPRVFSLTKIVEIAHFNMTRIRLVWTRIWNVLSQYFIQVGCHSNLSVAMYAVDSLRQLAMKFLERDELANYTFQNDFLRPFVVVMRQSQAVEIRELIIRCLSQMVLARVTNVKSGWKSMFMVFTTAAGDKDPMIVRLAFHTIEKIVREHFDHITETETATFTDCVNCLIAFTNNPHSLDVALNSIAFLRFCSFKLAEGTIGNVDALPEGSMLLSAFQPQRVVNIEHFGDQSSSFQSDAPQTLAVPCRTASLLDVTEHAGGSASEGTGAANTGVLASPGPRGTVPPASPPLGRHVKFIDRDEHVYFWFPLLVGLSELTFDPRQEIRHGALEVLFDTLKNHGGTFAESFWRRIFDSVLLPIFDHVRAECTDTTTFTSEKKRQQEEAWLYETCTKCLQHLIDIFAQFHSEAFSLLSRLLDLLRGFMNRSNQSLAAVGVAAFVRLVTQAGGLLDPAEWEEVMCSLTALVEEIAPNAAELISPAVAQQHHQQLLQPLTEALPPCSSEVSGGGAGTGSGGSDVRGGDASASAPSGSSFGSGAPIPARPFTLREGAGSRRLVKFRCQASVQLLLVQGCSEIYSTMGGSIPPGALLVLLNTLESIATHARHTDMDLPLRRQLAMQQALDHVMEDKAVSDPPLLRLESEASHAYLTVLLHVSLGDNISPLSEKAAMNVHMGSAQCSVTADVVAAATERLVRLCTYTLERFTLGSSSSSSNSSATMAGAMQGVAMSTPGFSSGPARSASDSAEQRGAQTYNARRLSLVAGHTVSGATVMLASPATEYAAFAPLVTSVLSTLAMLPEATFHDNLTALFPLMTCLICAEYAPPEVLRALSLLFNQRIGPLAGMPSAAAPKTFSCG